MPRGSRTDPFTFNVVKGNTRPGVCRHCRKKVVFALTVTRKGAKWLPFNKEPIYAPEVVSGSGVKFEKWPSDQLHMVTCAARQGAGA